METKGDFLGAKNTVRERFHEGTHNIVPEADIGPIPVYQSLDNREWVFHSKNER